MYLHAYKGDTRPKKKEGIEKRRHALLLTVHMSLATLVSIRSLNRAKLV